MYRWYTARILLTYSTLRYTVLAQIGGANSEAYVKHIAAPRFILGAICLLLLCAGTASAQLFPGRITGAVRDAQGAAVVGATVKLTNPSTGLERTDTSDQNGEFNFPELALGNYSLTVTKDGFQTSIIKDIITSETTVNTVTPVLTVGTVTSEVTVTSAPALIQTETNFSGGGHMGIQG